MAPSGLQPFAILFYPSLALIITLTFLSLSSLILLSFITSSAICISLYLLTCLFHYPLTLDHTVLAYCAGRPASELRLELLRVVGRAAASGRPKQTLGRL